MEVQGHALRKVMGRTALCECGERSEVTIKEAMDRTKSKLLDMVMDLHREHLKRIRRRP